MAFIKFLGHKKDRGVFFLSGPTTLGRSLECDIYIPDVFVSRHHCRFEKRDGYWYMVDLQSRNGVWYEAKRRDELLLKPGDTMEVGSIAIVFNEGTPEYPSNPAPFGMGLSVTEMMDTVCCNGIRPSVYSKRLSRRKASWLKQAQNRSTKPEVDAEPEEEVVELDPWVREEWAELDIELRIAAGQEAMADWQPPIFNPTKEQRLGTAAAAPAAGSVLNPAAATPASSTWDEDRADFKLINAQKADPTGSADHDSIDDEVAAHIRNHAGHNLKMPKKSWNPFKRKPKSNVIDGVEIESYGFFDRLKDKFSDMRGSATGFSKLNPTIAGAAILAILLLGFVAFRFGPSVVGGGGPHVYEPTPEQRKAWGLDKAKVP